MSANVGPADTNNIHVESEPVKPNQVAGYLYTIYWDISYFNFGKFLELLMDPNSFVYVSYFFGFI